jgi:large subunit ribosomal protein L22
MTGPKLNEGALLIPEGQPTTKATAKYLRGSASKAREVLDLIRGLDVRRADEVLQFTTRDVAQDIRKVLASAVANAVHNDAQDADELYVLAAFADEGPTLRRFRPRARGRATRIRKRTCHITIVVTRLSEERLEILQARQQASSPAARRRAGTSVQSRRDRVERSRTRAQGLRAGATETPEAATDELPEETPAADAEVVDATEVIADDVEAADASADETTAETASDTGAAETSEAAASAKLQAFADAVAPAEDEAAAATEAETEAPAAEIELPEGAVVAPEDGSIPAGYEIKGNQNSMKYHVPGGRYYDVTIAELFFDTPEHAEAAGYEPPAADTEGDS